MAGGLPSREEVLRRVGEWLERGSVDAGDIADLPWEVRYVERPGGGLAFLVAVNPRVPVEVRVGYLERRGVVRFTAHTGILLADLPPEAKLRAYRVVLLLNAGPLVKAYLAGPHEEVVLSLDFSVKSFSEEEMNDGLASLLAAYVALHRELGLTRQLREELLLHLLELVKERLEKGETPEEVEEFLVKASGLSREEAEKLVELARGGRAGGGGGGPVIYS